MKISQRILLAMGVLVTTCVQSQQFADYKASDISPDTSSAIIPVSPQKYLHRIDAKIQKYTDRVSSKTEKTLERLSRWESRVKRILEKANPKAAERLFGREATFQSLLAKIKEGKRVAGNYTARYDRYRDELTTSVKYIEQEKQRVNTNLPGYSKAIHQINILSQKESDNEYIQEFIKQRRKQLINEGMQYIGKSRSLRKINKEAYYYAETLRNYKEIFSNPGKAEQAVLNALNKLPAFQKFMGQNSQLSGIFASPSSFSGMPVVGSMPVINGLAPRAAVQQFISAATFAVNNNTDALQNIQGQVNSGSLSSNSNWRDKIEDINGNSEADPGFKPNTQRSKSFGKRLEAGTDLQFGKSSSFIPGTANIGVKLGYKLNDKSSVGIGMNYIMGLGRGWNNINLTNQGVGFRTYLGWKLKKGFGIQGGSEWNYMLQFKNFEQLQHTNAWQHSALLGLNKSYSISKKIKGNIQVLYDLLYHRNQPRTQPVVVRFGYGF